MTTEKNSLCPYCNSEKNPDRKICWKRECQRAYQKAYQKAYKKSDKYKAYQKAYYQRKKGAGK